MKALRQTVDLSAYPDLVVVYLGMTENMLTGVKTLLGFGPKIEGSVAARPDGLLLHENIFYSLFPLHLGMRQYWRDFDSLERFTRTDTHREWWKQFFARHWGDLDFVELAPLRGPLELSLKIFCSCLAHLYQHGVKGTSITEPIMFGGHTQPFGEFRLWPYISSMESHHIA